MTPLRQVWIILTRPLRAAQRQLSLLGTGSLAMIGLVLLLASIVVFPPLLVRSPSNGELRQLPLDQRVTAESQRATVRNDVRTTLIQTLGGILILATAYFSWQQIKVSRQGQVNDRFSRSVDQLGEIKQTEVRLGGIYALEQIARDPAYTRPIAEIYAAYLRTHSVHTETRRPVAAGAEGKLEGPISDGVRPLPSDVVAVLAILVKGGLWQDADLRSLDLSGVALPGAKLPGVRLPNAVLTEAELDRADLTNADLSFAVMKAASLQGAVLIEALLNEAVLDDGKLRNASLEAAQVRGAKLRNVVMDPVKAELADFTGADLSGAKLKGARLRGAILISAILRGADLQGADLTDAKIAGADFAGADTRNVNWTRVDRSSAKGIGQ